jgi:hypothetical protein
MIYMTCTAGNALLCSALPGGSCSVRKTGNKNTKTSHAAADLLPKDVLFFQALGCFSLDFDMVLHTACSKL